MWALGCILICMATGRRSPLGEEKKEPEAVRRARVVEDGGAALRAKLSGCVPADHRWVRVIAKCLSPFGERWSSAEAKAVFG